MNANQRKAWLRRREEARSWIPEDAMLAALVSVETGYNSRCVERALTGEGFPNVNNERIRAARDELAPLIASFYSGDAA